MKKTNYNLKEAGTSLPAYKKTSARCLSVNKPDANQILQSAISCGILPLDAVSNIENMIKRTEVLKVHKYKISQGKGKDTRWFTRVPDDSKPDHRRKVFKSTEQDLYDYLYAFYNGLLNKQKDTLKSIYPLWKNYKLSICNRENTVYRNDLDWKKYYLNEELSQELINKPIEKITRADIKSWAHQIIKKYEMTRKKYMNVQTIIKQVFEYLMDNEMLSKNPMEYLKIEPTMFRKTAKKPAEKEVFYTDEIEAIIKRSKELAVETNDESYLAIPLFFLTGLRIGEILALSHNDFDRDHSSVFVHSSLCTQLQMKEDGTWSQRKYAIEDHLKRNAEPRTILVPAQVFELENQIRRMQMKKASLDSYLFHAKTPHVVAGKLYRLCDELGISRRSPHKCRKTYISNLLNKGMDADFVREQAGHKDLQTTLNCYTYSTTRNEEKVRHLEEILAI
jgi:integrase